MAEYNYIDPELYDTPMQKEINKLFLFEIGPAKCIQHGVTRCQACTSRASDKVDAKISAGVAEHRDGINDAMKKIVRDSDTAAMKELAQGISVTKDIELARNLLKGMAAKNRAALRMAEPYGEVIFSVLLKVYKPDEIIEPAKHVFTKSMKDEYVTNGGNRCPFCKSNALDIAGSFNGDTGIGTQEVFCNNCEETFTDLYTLTGVRKDG